MPVGRSISQLIGPLGEWSVGWLVGLSKKVGKLHFHASIGALCFFSESVINTIMSHLAANKDFLRDAFKGKNYLEIVMLTIV